MENNNELIILIAEDDDGHFELIIERLEKSSIHNKVTRFVNGEEAWHFLSGTGKNEVRDKNKNYLLLLDINMPKMDGIEVLRRIKADENLKDILVIMLTTTDNPKEIEACNKLGCTLYITKPVEIAKFMETLKDLGSFIQLGKVLGIMT